MNLGPYILKAVGTIAMILFFLMFLVFFLKMDESPLNVYILIILFAAIFHFHYGGFGEVNFENIGLVGAYGLLLYVIYIQETDKKASLYGLSELQKKDYEERKDRDDKRGLYSYYDGYKKGQEVLKRTLSRRCKKELETI